MPLEMERNDQEFLKNHDRDFIQGLALLKSILNGNSNKKNIIIFEEEI